MAAPKHTPIDPTDRPRAYSSPDFVPGAWNNTRKASITGRQPRAERLGHQGPDQGYVLSLAEHVRPRIKVTAGESIDDAIQGCIGIALRRASHFGRAPVIHDLDIALTMWGYFLDTPPADLVATRSRIFCRCCQRGAPLRGGARNRRHGAAIHHHHDAGDRSQVDAQFVAGAHRRT